MCSHWLPNTLITHLFCPLHCPASLTQPTKALPRVPPRPLTHSTTRSRFTLCSHENPDTTLTEPLFRNAKTGNNPEVLQLACDKQTVAQPYNGALLSNPKGQTTEARNKIDNPQMRYARSLVHKADYTSTTKKRKKKAAHCTIPCI